MMSETHAIERVQRHQNTKIGPGEPFRFSEASTVGDAVAQGDLYIQIVESVPDGFDHQTQSKDIDRQLVPGNTVGSKHCLESLATVDLYWPAGWSHSPTYEGLQGPALVCKEDTSILHPTHGTVTIPAGFTVVTGYQRVFDEEQKRERRAAD